MRSTDWRRALLLGQLSTFLAGFLLPHTTFAQEGPFVYVPNRNTASVSLIDIPGQAVQPGTIGVGDQPFSIAVRGDQSLVYVSNFNSNKVSVIDTATNTVVATIPVGDSPIAIALSPDGTRAYTTNQNSNNVSVIDTSTNTVVATIPVGNTPRSVAVTPDGSHLYVTNFGSNSVSVIDSTTNAIVATVSVGASPFDIAISPDGGRAYVTNFYANSVSVIDTSSNTTLTTISVGTNPRLLAISPDGTRALVANQSSNTVSVVDLATNTVTATISVGNQPIGVGFSPDGTRAYVTNITSNNVYVIDTATNTVVAILATNSPVDPGVCGNGNALLTTGNTFRANNGGAIGCTMTGPGTGPVFTGGTMQIRGAGVASALPMFLAAQGGTIDTQANTATFSGVISGPGALTKIGTGTLVLSGDNSYSGATLINQGTLRAGAVDTFSPDSAMNVAAGAVLDLAGFDQEIGSLAGAGNVLLGAGKLTTGGDGTDTSFSGAISGSGGLTKAGGGTFTLAGVNSYSGATTVADGTLVVNGSIANSEVTVADGALLKGNGTLGGLALAGTLAPGNSIGTLNVAGNATIAAGSVYELEINAAGQSDRLAATGTVTLGGGEVVVLNAPGSYAAGTQYTIVTAGGGVTGTFASVTDSLPLLDAVLSYHPGSVVLTLEDNEVPVGSLGKTPNQRSTGAGIDSIGGGALENALSTLDAAEIPGALDLLSGEIHASIKSGFIEESRYVRDAASDRLRDAFGAVGATPLPVLGYGESGPMAAEADTPLAMWGEALGAWGSFDGDGNAAEFDRSTGGFLTGMDGLVSDHARLGLIAGYTHSSFDVDARNSSGSANSVHLGAYGGAQIGALGLRGGAAYSWHFVDTSRTAAFGSFAENLDASYDAGTGQIFGEAGYRIDTASAAFEPFAGIAYVDVHTDGFTETGGAAALTHAASDTDQTFSTLGVRASTPVSLGASEATLSGMIGWRHAFSDVTPDAVFAFAGGAPFAIAGAPIARDALALEAGLDVQVGARTSLGIAYSGQIGDGAQDHGANARLTVNF